uniref:Putative mitochondrial carrier protein n=1 Tax=Trypanosoma congolense (strain IL3000) TaxID=1068625 RepID=G0UUN2_TRYCI|nr:putative mitochondrial carrier protein [Trypanosoma congolense IL3000]
MLLNVMQQHIFISLSICLSARLRLLFFSRITRFVRDFLRMMSNEAGVVYTLRKCYLVHGSDSSFPPLPFACTYECVCVLPSCESGWRTVAVPLIHRYGYVALFSLLANSLERTHSNWMDASVHALDAQQEQQPAESNEALPPLAHAAAGVLGASLSTAIFYPLDVVRTHAHVCGQRGSNSTPSLQCMLRQKGLRGMYGGFSLAVVSYSIGWGTYMGVFRAVQGRLSSFVSGAINVGKGEKVAHVNSSSLMAACDVASGTAAAVVMGTVVTPLTLLKTRRQLHAERSGVSICSSWSCLRGIVASEGLRSLMRGLGPQILLNGNIVVQIAIYERLRRYVVEQKSQPSSFDVAIISSLSKAAATVLFNPMEVVRTRLQDVRSCSRPEYSSMVTGLRTIWCSEGTRGLYRGLAVNVCRVVPATTLAFVLYEKFLLAFSTMNKHERAIHIDAGCSA